MTDAPDRNFLQDLAVAYSRTVAKPSPQFLVDLGIAARRTANSGSIDPSVLIQLGKSLVAERGHASARLAKTIDTLPKEDPLRLPFGLFTAMEFGRMETAHTRTLAWLLDPSKPHGFGSAILLALLEYLVGESIDGLEEPIVCAEAVIDDSLRLDIFARFKVLGPSGSLEKHALVVEAKIYSLESPNQLERYERWIDDHLADASVIRVFLTPEAQPPRSSRVSWIPVSFEAVAGIIRNTVSLLNEAPGFDFARLYVAGILMDILGWPLPVTANSADPTRWNRRITKLSTISKG